LVFGLNFNQMIKIEFKEAQRYAKFMDDFFSLGGDLIFEKGKSYLIKSNGIIESFNYHLHYSDKLFQEQYKNV